MRGNLQRRRSSSLRVESLEVRRLLAVAAYELEIYSDAGGTPGELIADSSVHVGESFFARVKAREFGSFLEGLKTAAVNVDWDKGLLDVIDTDFKLENVITPDLPLFHSGNLNRADGSIRDLSGTAMVSSQVGRPIGNIEFETFAMIHMRAGNEPGTAEIQLSHSENIKTATVPLLVMTANNQRYETELVTILPAVTESVAPSIEIAAKPVVVETPIAEPENPPVPATENVVPTQTLASKSVPISAPTPTSAAVLVTKSEVDTTADLATSPDSAAALAVSKLTFDMNGDGVFDLADFGLLNQQAAETSSTTETLETQHSEPLEPTPITKHEATESAIPVVAEQILHSVCTAAPRGDVAAVEAWMNALAQAWLDDSEARARRRRENG